MATTISLRESHGQKYVVVVADVEVTYAATYFIRYTILETGATTDSETFTLAAGGTIAHPTTNGYFYDLTPGETYTIRGSLYNASTGALGINDEITITMDALPRPNDWYWDSTIASGYEINLTADEWNAFCNRINEFRVYDGLDECDFTLVYSGNEISASICNEARTAINAISNRGTLPSRAVSGGPLYASFFTDLRDALNAVP